MAKNEAKIKFTAETGEFNSEIKKSSNEMSKLKAELKLNEAQMENTGKSVEGLEKKHSLLESQLKASRTKVDALSGKVEAAARIFGENSEEVAKLERQLANARTEEEKIKTAIANCNDELNEQASGFKKAGDAAKGAGDGFTVAKGIITDLASQAIQLAIGKMSEFIGYLRDLPEATRELRQDMATLETSFSTAGFTTEQATNTWKDLYAIFGEDDRAVEASNLIAKMADNQKDLNDWVTITTGVYGQFQDSLSVEGLAEASMETAKTGAVTGALADALNWSSDAASMFSKYMSEDVVTAEDAFNEALKKCTTEEERQALITDTLTALYGDSAEKYRETAGAQMEAKEAVAENTLAQNEAAEAIEPVTTAWEGLKTELLVAVTPAIKAVCDGLQDAIKWLKEHPTATQALVAALGVLVAGVTALSAALGIYTVIQLAANAALLPIIGIAAAVVVAIAAVTAIGVVLYKNWDKIKTKCSELWKSVKTKFSDGKNAVVNKVNELKSKVTEKFNALKTAITKPIEAAKDKVKGVIDKIKGFFSNLKLSLPKIKLPHFKIKGEFSLNPPSVPKLSIDWYRKAMASPMILNSPTIFGYSNGRLLGGGEAGREVVSGANTLMDMIQGAVNRASNAYDISTLASAIEDLASRPIELKINDRQFALATASAGDTVNGLRTTFKSRGLALD